VRPASPTVLVVEDSVSDRAWLVTTLTDAGYAVESAATGREALARCRVHRFDAITLDLLLPDVSGLEVLVGVRGDALNRETPVIIVTVIAEKGVGADFHVHDILTKPVRGEDLLASLRALNLGPGQSHRVMVVDDDRRALKLADRMLRQLGYHAVCHSTAKGALRAARHQLPAAVILDLNMPELDGFPFLERFQRWPEARRTPVIVWSAMELTARQRKHLQASAQAIASKSRGSATLIEELTAHAPLPRARAEPRDAPSTTPAPRSR
jgi:CheY-like chemotaxis protein